MFYTKLEFRVTCAFVCVCIYIYIYICIYVCMYVLVALEKGIKFLVWTWESKISVWRIINSIRNINFNNTWQLTNLNILLPRKYICELNIFIHNHEKILNLSMNLIMSNICVSCTLFMFSLLNIEIQIILFKYLAPKKL